jgi:hypothetical protein
VSDPISRIQQLVALAASSSEEEARSAAVQACRLIREHKIVFLLPEDAPKKTASGESSFFDDLGSLLDNLSGLAGPSRTYPFDPFTAPFRVVAEYARTRGVEIENRGDGRYGARFGGKLIVGTWPEIIRAVFSHIETPAKRGSTGR